VRCPAHGWRYDVRTGQTIHEPDDEVARFLVQVVDGIILVALG
jgi:nitrite reductase/ring-hydroxylating ferredoxin subunit